MEQHESDSDTRLIELLKRGDEHAANQLISRYFDRVIKLAERHLQGRRVPTIGSDDIAASVFESLWKQADSSRLAGKELKDSQELWKLLCKMVAFKTCDHLRREHALKRGGGRVLSGSAAEKNGNPKSDRQTNAINQAAGKPSDPAEICILQEQYQRLMDTLDNDTLREVATMRLSSHSVSEIADAFGGKSDRWVGRKLKLIREIWQSELDQIDG